MNTKIEIYKKKEENIKNSVLILIAFASVFFPRVLEAIGIPSFINFLHFALVPAVCLIVVVTTRVKDRNQISTALSILTGIVLLLGVTVASALINHAGVINVFVNFMLLSEWFIFIFTIVCVPFSQENYKWFRACVIGMFCFHIFLALLQSLLLQAGILRVTTMVIPQDNVQGVFYLSGSGHVVGASVSMAFGLYYLISAKTAPIWLRGSVFFLAFLQLLQAEAKQVVAVWLVGWCLLIVLKLKSIKTLLQYVISAIVAFQALLWCMQNIPAFRSFNTWNREGLYGPDGLATQKKLIPFEIVTSYYESPLNWLFGLGPGHTVGRLGGWMLKDYQHLLRPFDATTHPVSDIVWELKMGRKFGWLDSSMFSPFWGWAGIWGDLGLLGLGACMYLLFTVWRRICLDDFSKFQIITVIIYGFIFTQMEEPGYMLSVALLIGMRWQELRMSKELNQRLSHLSLDSNHYPELSRGLRSH
jgi:hypothetical protein